VEVGLLLSIPLVASEKKRKKKGGGMRQFLFFRRRRKKDNFVFSSRTKREKRGRKIMEASF